MDKLDKVSEYYNLGYNCSQSIFAAYADDLDLGEDEALKIAAGFSMGIGEGEVCGAVIGAIMVLGLKYGDMSSEIPLEDKINEFKMKFKNKYKTILCRELLGHNISIEDDYQKIMEKDLLNKLCPKIVDTAVSILQEIYEE